MPVRFLKNTSEIADVSVESPLPVALTNASLVPADTLLVATLGVNNTANRDLLGSTTTEQPTLTGCGQYRKLIWTYFRQGADATTYWVYARTTDPLSGEPLSTGWQLLTASAGETLPGGANEWGRIDIPATGDAYYDQYRIVVQRTGGSANYDMTFKIVGVR
ncbi:MAG: hypothetical protein WHS44_00175 [Fimbriimonadales bacterium]|nr:MAG: hypothetical protein KatS3mg018_0912 [Fimbriimonadales bacterium]